MARQIFVVNAYIVDSNGTFNFLNGYPKQIDSRIYQNDLEKTQYRAEAEFSDVWSAMCKADTRQVQTVTLSMMDGNQIDSKTRGSFPSEE